MRFRAKRLPQPSKQNIWLLIVGRALHSMGTFIFEELNSCSPERLFPHVLVWRTKWCLDLDCGGSIHSRDLDVPQAIPAIEASVYLQEDLPSTYRG